MDARTARGIFYGGTLVSLALFLALTADTHRQIATLSHADALSPSVVAGKRVWHKYNCNDCHTILGFGSYYAPDLTKVFWRRGAEGIQAVVRTPENFTTWRKMPRFHLSDPELADLTAFLEWTSRIDTHGWPPQDQKLRPGAGRSAAGLGASPGMVLFREKDCVACHSLFEIGGDLGPDLTHAGARLSYDTIERILEDPRSVNPEAVMPTPDLTAEERDRLARFLDAMK